MTKTGTQLEREIQETLGLPAAITKKWRTKVAAFKRALKRLEDGNTDTKEFLAAARARDALDTVISEAAAHLPYVPGGSPHLAPPIVALQKERDQLVRGADDKSAMTIAMDKGTEANRRARNVEMKRLDEEIREQRRPYDWMRK